MSAGPPQPHRPGEVDPSKNDSTVILDSTVVCLSQKWRRWRIVADNDPLNPCQETDRMGDGRTCNLLPRYVLVGGDRLDLAPNSR